MITLSDRILKIVPATRDGLSLSDAIKSTGSDSAHVRSAFMKLYADGRANIVRRGRGRAFYLVLLEQNVRSCLICFQELHAKRKDTKTCSYSCARHLAWQNEDMRRRHQISVKRAAARPERRERMKEIVRALVSDPAEIARRSECNRRSWADPESRARRILSIKDAWKGDKAKERRAKASKKKLALWDDPEWKALTVAAMRSGRRGRFKRAVIELARLKPEISETEIAARLQLSVEQVKILMRRAYHDSELDRKPQDGRKRKQSTEEIAHRVIAGNATKRRTGRYGGGKPKEEIDATHS